MHEAPVVRLDCGMDLITLPAPLAAPMRCTEAITLVAALRAASRSGLLDALDRWAPCSAAELAARTHLVERAVVLTLGALEVGAQPLPARVTTPPTAPAHAWAAMQQFSEHVVAYVETGAPTAHVGAARYVAPLRVIGGFVRPLVEAALPHLVRPGLRVLELGAGTAPWSRALVAAEPTVTAVAVDLDPVIAQLRDLLAADGTTGIECVTGDVRTVALTGATGFDLVVVSGLCRLLGADDNARLFRRCAGWIAPAGRLVLCDALADADDADGSLALYALGLAARSAAEALWPSAQYDRWLADAGFAPATVVARGRAGHAVAFAAPVG
jgi:SAM-dependent methyltransferase